MKTSLRLNRFLAAAGIASRRRCDDLIRQGRVIVNGTLVTELGSRVDPRFDEVSFDGVRVLPQALCCTLVLHKPRDVLVAARDSRGRRTVMDLLTDLPVRVFPVGRLDYRSEGLLLFTNDGDLAYRLAHPRFKVAKLYRVEIEGSIAPDVPDALRAGVTLEDGPTQPAKVQVLAEDKQRTIIEIELREGRKRQIRRMLSLFGQRVTRLTRVRFGPLAIGDLEAGNWRELAPEEIDALKRAAGLGPDGEKGDGK